jgi:hypothetical protein
MQYHDDPMSLSYIFELAIDHYESESFTPAYAAQQVKRILMRAEQLGVWCRHSTVVSDIERFVEEEIGV